jgi:Skp family chaperone for outer membrane proteins
VRFIGKAAIAMAMVTLSSLAPVVASAEDGHRVAVVDVAYIFKNHPGIKAQVTEVENDLKNYDAELKQKREELKQAAAQLKTLKINTPNYTQQEELVASMESKLRLDMARKRKELGDAEARIYFENYKRIAAGVKFLAQHYKINLVLRYNSEGMDLENGETVIRGVMKNIVYHDDSLDMTKGVMQYLDQTLKVAGNPPATK